MKVRGFSSQGAGPTCSADHPAAERALEWIGALYELDQRSDGNLERLAELRRSEAPAILEPSKAWLMERAGDTHVSIGKACAYTLGIWERLTVFVENPLVPLDNNATERSIRGPVVGRKNHYGSKSRRGTEVAATLCSILETAKLQKIDPAAYVASAVAAAERGETLMPWDFASSSK